MVLHAPCHSASPDGSLEAIQKWWSDTIRLLQQANLSAHVWILADLNADLGSFDGDHFSVYGHFGTSPQALVAEDAVQQLDWFAPSTFEWCHSGSHATWKHPRGSDHRLDFILCSRAAFQLAHSTAVDTQHDSGFAHDDHLPVRLNVLGWLELAPGPAKFQWDFEAMVNPQRCADFQAALSTLPIPTWTTDVDTHVKVWETNVLQLAQQFFARGPKAKQRPRLREATINLIALKRSILDYARGSNLMLDPDLKRQLKDIEKEIRQRVCSDQRDFYDASPATWSPR